MSHIIDHAYYRDSWGTPEMRAVFSEEARFQRWMEFWAVLAEAQAEAGLIPAAAAAEIRAKARQELLDPAVIRTELARAGHTLIPVLRAYERICENGAGEWLHYGATTQDVQDTALSLEMRDAWKLLFASLKRLEDACLAQAAAHRDLVIVGRTHNQHAMPMTLGMKCATWAAEVRRNLERMKALPPRAFFVMLHGAVGTASGLGPDPRGLMDRMADRLGLHTPPVCWASSRDGVAEFIALTGLCAGTVGRIANEIFQLSRTELAELNEPAPDTVVGSTTMPHKRNAVRSEFSGAMAKVVMNNVTLGLQAMIVAHERDASVWRLDWHTVPESAIMLDRAINHMANVVGAMTVDRAKIAANLELTDGAIMSEAVMFRIGEKVGKQTAHGLLHHLVNHAAATGQSFRAALENSEDLRAHLDAAEIETLLDYRQYLGTAGQQVDDTIALSRAQAETDPVTDPA